MRNSIDLLAISCAGCLGLSTVILAKIHSGWFSGSDN